METRRHRASSGKLSRRMGSLSGVSSKSTNQRYHAIENLESWIMWLQLKGSTWTLIGPWLRRLLPSLPSSGSWVCESCGYAIDARGEAGTSSFTLTIDCYPQKQSRYKHAVVLTDGGRLSILCESSAFAPHRSPPDTGSNAGISYTAPNLSAEPCGCDAGANWKCEQHRLEPLDPRD